MRLAKAMSIAVALAGAAVAPFVAHAQTSPVALPDTPADPTQ